MPDENTKKEGTRKKKSLEEKIQAIDAKIQKHQAEIQRLKEQKQRLLNPELSMREVLSKIKESGLKPNEIIEKLGIALDN